MFLSHITYNGFVKIISGNFNGSAYYSTSQRDYCDIRGTSTDIYDHISTWLRNVNSGSNGCCNRFFDNGNLSCTCGISGILYRLLFYFCGTTRYTDTDSRFSSEEVLTYCLLNEIFYHLFRDGIIRNNTLS